MAEYGEFDWSDPKRIVIKRVDAIAVYKNEDGDIVIRQERAMVQVDAVVTIPVQHAYSVIEAIQRQLKGPLVTPSSLG
ncbi:MAG: hypothetical protein ACXWUH_12710 [Burkholderiales bacterium]